MVNVQYYYFLTNIITKTILFESETTFFRFCQFTISCLVGPYLVQKRIWYICTIFGRIWYKCTILGPKMVQFSTEYGTNIVPYSVGISFSMLAKTYLVHTKKTHKNENGLRIWYINYVFLNK